MPTFSAQNNFAFSFVRSLAKATGASAAKIKPVVAKEGKKAGITSSGARSKFAYALK